jgi:hypothetical protein
MTWPVAQLDPIMRLRAVAAAYPSAGVAETVVALPFDDAWAWLMDLERSVPTFDTEVIHVRIHERDGDRLRLTARNRRVPFGIPFDVTIEPGFCIMRARSRAFLVVMAAMPTDDGRTRFAHAEALPLPRLRWLHGRFQRMVEADVRGVERTIGT